MRNCGSEMREDLAQQGIITNAYSSFCYGLGILKVLLGCFMLRNNYASFLCLDSQEQAPKLTTQYKQKTKSESNQVIKRVSITRTQGQFFFMHLPFVIRLNEQRLENNPYACNTN